jgi:hypothetical protein
MSVDEVVVDLTAQERSAIVIWFLARGHSFTTLEIAALTGLTRQGAWMMMDRLARQLPLSLEHSRWRLLA